MKGATQPADRSHGQLDHGAMKTCRIQHQLMHRMGGGDSHRARCTFLPSTVYVFGKAATMHNAEMELGMTVPFEFVRTIDGDCFQVHNV